MTHPDTRSAEGLAAMTEERLNEIEARFDKKLLSERILGWGGSAVAIDDAKAVLDLITEVRRLRALREPAPVGEVAKAIALLREKLNPQGEFPIPAQFARVAPRLAAAVTLVCNAVESLSASLAAAERERDDAVKMLCVIGEETVMAGLPAGDRTVALANVRALIAGNAVLRGALAEVTDWVRNWSPNFVDDDEWPATERRVRTALATDRKDRT